MQNLKNIHSSLISMFGRSFTILVYIASVSFFGIFLKCSNFVNDLFCSLYPEDERHVFDYIIVGGGSAGSLLANKLAHNGMDKILVLEAGRNNLDLMAIPSVGLLLQKTPFDWEYKTIPQTNSCLGLDENVSLWPMGKVVGGTSMLNNMLYVRGHQQDFNEWFKDKDNYDYSDILTHFKKLENMASFNNEGTADAGEPIYVSDIIFSTSVASFILKAATSLGYPILHDNYDSILGFTLPKANLFNGKRWTSADKLKKNTNINLLVKTNSIVERVLFKSNFEAYGVKYNVFGKKRIALANKAVILSAGVVGTPKILMLSGIGKKSHLEEVGIKSILDLPVGDNLQDHVTTGFDLVLLNHSLDLGIESMLSPSSILEYFLKSSGPWTTTGCELLAFFDTQNNTFNRPNLQFMVMPLGIKEDNGYYLRKLMGISDRIWSNYFSKIDKNSMTILPVLLHPKSRGTVRLASKDPSVQPLIDPQYLSNPDDVDELIKGIELIKTLINTKDFRSLGAEFNTNVFPDCAQHVFDTKEYWECYVRHLTITAYHPVGTCKMGKSDDPSTVVGFNFRVKYTNKLYVVDGSVLPTMPSGNVNAPILMLAEMAADLVRKDYYLSSKECKTISIFIPETMC